VDLALNRRGSDGNGAPYLRIVPMTMAQNDPRSRFEADPVIDRVLAWCRTNGSYRLLPDGACSWRCGGCALLGLAVSQAFPDAEVWGLWGRPGRDHAGVEQKADGDTGVLQHIMIRFGGHFFDGGGRLGTLPEEAATTYGVAEDVFVGSWRAILWAVIAETEIPCDRQSVEAIRRRMAAWIARPARRTSKDLYLPT